MHSQKPDLLEFDGHSVVQRNSSSHLAKTMCYIFGAGCGVIGGVTVAMLALISLSSWGLDQDLGYALNPFNRSNLDVHHHIGATTRVPLMSAGWNASVVSYNRTPELEASIGKAIKDGEEKWGTNDAIDQVKDPMVLDEQIMRDLIVHHFSKKRIKYWLAKGLNVNATNRQRACLLMGASYIGDPSDVQFLLNNGANVHAQSTDGLTSLFAISERMSRRMSERERIQAEQIMDLLLQKGADPCKEGGCFKSPKSYVKCLYDKDPSSSDILEKILEKFHSEKACLAR
ncbi:ankyrin repeat domain-containing protein [Cardinium endosymbiont of Nabis limbatus]|uniref:ankyrin repeat domain-containing protein n=1 Tax=Cardinium endosymbiont of Nabis limbatus TaxID=3066217 RepID=UPI003AF3F0B4